MYKVDLGDPNNWPTLNGVQEYDQWSNLPAGRGRMVVLNNSPYGLDVYTGGDPYRVDAGIGRLLAVDDGGYQLRFVSVYAIPGTNANDLRRVTVEIYEPDEEILEHYPIELIRNTNVLNTVQTGSSVQQTQSVVYDQSAINGETPSSVSSKAQAGAGAGKVDVVDANPTGGIHQFAMTSGTFDVLADATLQTTGKLSVDNGSMTTDGTGQLTFGGAVPITTTAAGAGFEHGSTAAPGTPFVDFHSSGNAIDYDARIIASGGDAGVGHGTLQLLGRSIQIARLDNGLATSRATQEFLGTTDPATYTTVNEGDSWDAV